MRASNSSEKYLGANFFKIVQYGVFQSNSFTSARNTRHYNYKNSLEGVEFCILADSFHNGWIKILSKVLVFFKYFVDRCCQFVFLGLEHLNIDC